LTASNERRVAVPHADSPNAEPIDTIRSASLKIIGDQRPDPGIWPPFTP
jgi:hypothetical protein